MKSILLCAMFCIAGVVIAQEQDDLHHVRKAVENYYQGYIERDSLKLYSAFDVDHGTMKVPVEDKGGTLYFENRYFKEILPVWSNRDKLSTTDLQQCQLTIHHIEIENQQLAVAKITMKVVNDVYVDVLSLQKANGVWKITNKMYYVAE